MIKTFKIGEEAVGGVIQVSTRHRNVYEIKAIDSKTKLVVAWRFAYGLDELETFVEDISTPYWADKIVTHFKNKLKL